MQNVAGGLSGICGLFSTISGKSARQAMPAAHFVCPHLAIVHQEYRDANDHREEAARYPA